jgi:hypothetical protein
MLKRLLVPRLPPHFFLLKLVHGIIYKPAGKVHVDDAVLLIESIHEHPFGDIVDLGRRCKQQQRISQKSSQ